MPVMSQSQIEEFLKESRIAHLVTLRPDGSPHVAPVWYEYADGLYLVWTSRRFRKVRNIEADARAVVSIASEDQPYRYVVAECDVEVSGKDIWDIGMSIATRYEGAEGRGRLPGAVLRGGPERRPAPYPAPHHDLVRRRLGRLGAAVRRRPQARGAPPPALPPLRRPARPRPARLPHPHRLGHPRRGHLRGRERGPRLGGAGGDGLPLHGRPRHRPAPHAAPRARHPPSAPSPTASRAGRCLPSPAPP